MPPAWKERLPQAPIYAGVFLVSASVLLLQIALTRIFSFTIWYHFAYVTISVALLGYGASGVLLAVRPGLAGRDPNATMQWTTLFAGVSVLGALLGVAAIPFHPFELLKRPAEQAALMLAFYLVVTLPFFFAGVAMALALKTMARDVARLYFFDLLGAAVGCLLVVQAIWILSTPGAVAAAAVTMLIASVAFSLGRGGKCVTSVVALVAVAATGAMMTVRLTFWSSPEKFVTLILADPIHNILAKPTWTPIFRTDVIRFKDEEFVRRFGYAGWGVSPRFREEAAVRGPTVRIIAHDGDACALIYRFDGDLAKLMLFERHILRTPYVLLDRPKVLVIGAGGGADVVNGIAQGASHITAVELDPVTIDVVRGPEADFAGHLYDRPDVTAIAGEGRSVVRSHGARYDLIQMTGVDTMAALSTGAYVLSESYLYTVEAMLEMYDHLTPTGVLSIVVADFNERYGFPRHTLRHLALFVEALRRRGIEDAASRVAVVASAEAAPQVDCLLKKAPFTEGERDRLRRFADEQAFEVWALPGMARAGIHSRFMRESAEGRLRMLGEMPLRLDATTDDNPFFFNFYRWRDIGKSLRDIDVGHTLATAQIVLGLTLLMSLLLSGTLILLPLLVWQRRGLLVPGRWGFLAYFAGIGLGFIFIEISFVQRLSLFLGYPTYALTVALFSLLASSGLGSGLTTRLAGPPARLVPIGLLSLVALATAEMFLTPRLFDALLGARFGIRAIAAIATIAPLGLLMGTFFPLGIRTVLRAGEELVPWAWGVNACASVVGTILAVMVAMTFGFRVVTLAALAAYGAAVLGLLTGARRVDNPT